MFRHNLLLIYRSFVRSRSTFLINLTGLSVGLAAALLICLWVVDEWQIDRYHEKDARLFQVMINVQRPHGIETSVNTPGLTARALADEMPEIEKTVGVIQVPPQVRGLLSFNDKSVRAHEYFASNEYFDMFSLTLLHGNRSGVLSEKNSIVLSDAMAINLFGTADAALGKDVVWSRGQFSGTYRVSGIFEHMPENSTVQFDVMFHFDLYMEKNPDWLSWTNRAPIVYVLLKEGVSPAQLNQKLSGFIQSKDPASANAIFLRKYSDQYLYNTYENGVLVGGRIAYVKLFSIVAIFILTIACINFMNLSTARASRRIKEIGIKKAMGAGRKMLVRQHLGESLLMAFVALLLAILMVDVLLPQFNIITGKHLAIRFDRDLVMLFFGITLLTGLLSGSYPALYLSGFNPAVVLQGKLQRSAGEMWTRKGLVVFQFVISVTLIVSVVVVWRQLAFIQSKNLGYKRENLVYFENEGSLRKNLESFLTEMRRIPGVVDVSDLSFNLTGEHASTYDFRWQGKTPEDSLSFVNLEADFGVIEMLGLTLEGRSFNHEAGDERANIIINETAAAIIGYDDPIGKTVNIWGREKHVIGVVKDFHFESLYEKVKPCFIQCLPNRRSVLVKIQGSQQQTLSDIEHLYHQYNEGFPFEYRFLDDDYQRLYVAEQRVASLSGYFSAVAIVISCLGLFALAAFSAERRQKEIGIRKVLGSNEVGIVLLLAGDFTRFVFIAIVIALPISYLMASHWLNSFAFRAPMEWWYFIGAGAAALLVAWLTVGTQAIRAAMVNPAKCLRDE
jgi:ABC-type antimicrobial peptide transport system permease subunit